MDTHELLVRKNLGAWTPNRYLSNLSLAYFEDDNFAYKKIFPVVPVDLPAGFFYEFSKSDLARDNFGVKPPYGHVNPAVIGYEQKPYSCKVRQAIIAFDELLALPFERDGGAFEPTRLRVKTLTEQLSTHLEIAFAKNFFNADAWSDVWQGATTANDAQKKFKYFNEANSDPINFLDARCVAVKREGRRRPNKLVLGVEVFSTLKNHATVQERIKYSGTTQNPAVVNENVLAQIFGVEQVIICDSTYNAAKLGQAEDMQYVCSAKDALLLYTPDNPAIDVPSAGYLFAWTISGGDWIAITQHDGDTLDHTNSLEALIAYDMQKTADCLAVFLKDCVK